VYWASPCSRACWLNWTSRYLVSLISPLIVLYEAKNTNKCDHQRTQIFEISYQCDTYAEPAVKKQRGFDNGVATMSSDWLKGICDMHGRPPGPSSALEQGWTFKLFNTSLSSFLLHLSTIYTCDYICRSSLASTRIQQLSAEGSQTFLYERRRWSPHNTTFRTTMIGN
jgi:hypothetical protein